MTEVPGSQGPRQSGSVIVDASICVIIVIVIIIIIIIIIIM